MFITKRKKFFFLSQCKVTSFFYICEKLNRNNYFCQKLVNCYDKLKNRKTGDRQLHSTLALLCYESATDFTGLSSYADRMIAI